MMLTGPSFPRPHRRLCPASADGGRAAGLSDVVAGRLRALSTRNLGAIAVALVVASYRAIRACRLGQSEHPDRRALCQEHPRVVLSTASAAFLRAHGLRPPCNQNSTEPVAWASRNPGQIIQGEGA